MKKTVLKLHRQRPSASNALTLLFAFLQRIIAIHTAQCPPWARTTAGHVLPQVYEYVLSDREPVTRSMVSSTQTCATSEISGKENGESMRLENYIRKFWPSSLGPLPAHIFRPSSTFAPPTLRHNTRNSIHIFRGCFNPSHIWHKLALCHAFFPQ